MQAPRTIRKKASTAARTRPSSKPSASTPRDDAFSSFSNTKDEKRRLKHTALVSRIEKAHKKPLKRRRPSKKLATTLESLVDALPDTEHGKTKEDAIEGARIRHASLKSRPGALKRKEKLEGVERERFQRNMALMASAPAGNVQAADGSKGVTIGTADRWAALRGHIQSSMSAMETTKN
jgi:hypothetical protein